MRIDHPLARKNCRSKVGQKFSLDGTTYTLEGILGDGAVGIVRKARSDSGIPVAVKFLAPDPKYIDPASFDDVAERFRHEGQRGSRLEHESLVRILGYADNKKGENFITKGPTCPFLIMRRVHGRTLEDYIRKTNHHAKGVFAINQERLLIALQLMSAIEYIHKKKLVHRDIKPANIFISSSSNSPDAPRIKLGDFGIVKWGDFHQSLATGTLTTTHQQGLGTLKYMSPEQAIKPKGVTSKSDIFSLGITLFELLTGEILSSPHHVYQIMTVRLSRGPVFARFQELGLDVSGCEFVAERLLDCFLRGLEGRPNVVELSGCFSALYSRLFEREWREDLN